MGGVLGDTMYPSRTTHSACSLLTEVSENDDVATAGVTLHLKSRNFTPLLSIFIWYLTAGLLHLNTGMMH